MILSYEQIEVIAVSALADFNEFLQETGIKCRNRRPNETPIDQFAEKYLGLTVSYAVLPTEKDLSGLTGYVDTEYRYEENGMVRSIPLKQNQILLDRRFLQCYPSSKLYGRRRFTLAHECAHQLLYQLEDDSVKAACQMKYAARTSYTYHELKTREDWNEWQANALASAILMPQLEIERSMHRFARGRRLQSYEGRFNYLDRSAISCIGSAFGVSHTAAAIRLRQLGYVDERPLYDYTDPVEVWP